MVSGGQRVFVLTGHGDGRFDVTWSGATGENPVGLAIADLDEDGLADLAVANHETDYVTLLFGIAGGAFERRDHSRFRVDVSPHPHAVRLHDMDSDGHADLLVDDRSPESIRLFRGRGDGPSPGCGLGKERSGPAAPADQRMLRMLHGQPVVEGERRLDSRAVARTPDCRRFQPPLGPLPPQDRFVTANAKLAVASRARAAPFAVAQNLRDTLPYFFDKDLDPRWAGGMAERVAGRERVPVHGSKMDRAYSCVKGGRRA